LDTLDVKILRELAQGRNLGLIWGDINPSLKDIASKLGVSRDTIRDRRLKLGESGLLKSAPIQANPCLLELSAGALSIDVDPDSDPGAMQKLQLVDGILVLQSHVGGLLGVVFYYQDESLQKKANLITSICDAKKAEFTRIPFPPCNLRLSRLDWEIVSALQNSTRETQSGIPSSLGISEKTLRRHLKRLVDGWAISRMLSVDVSRLRGAVLASLMVHYSVGQRVEVDHHLIQQLDEFLFFPGLWSSYSVYTLLLPSISEADAVLERTRSTKGIRAARIDLIKDHVELYGTLTEQVQSKLEHA
jgi:DNA-binding Lrp family transcriptional regulator